MALERIGPYLFRGILGRGGMGTVYRAVNEETGEHHAVKILAPTYAHDMHFRGRFESEINALIQLDHPNIVRLLSYGQEDGMLYFSMELVEGNSLFQMQKKGHRFHWREIISVAKDVATGLRHAHDRGIIHRDLKPGNLLMTKTEDGLGQVKITDFGIAKRFGSSQNTGTNVLGTMDFMSPEQAKGEPVTVRSDLYSLGTVLFTLMSGRPPFSANSVEESLRNLTRVPAPRISTVVPDVPRELDDLIKRLMSKRPENRTQTAQALLHQINEAEAILRDYSEAKTAQHQIREEEETFDIRSPKTIENTVAQKSRLPGTEIHQETRESFDGEQEFKLAPETHVDYHNPVTDQIRKLKVESTVPPEREKSKGVLPLLLAFVAVVAIGVYGAIQAYAPPSAEDLYAEIEEHAEFPNRKLDEIAIFLKHYDNDPRADSIRELQKIGEAINLYNGLSNTLTVRRNLPGENRLSEVEAQFLEIVDLSQDDPETADRKMAAFINVFSKSKDLTEGDKKCLDAAVSYRVKLEYDSKNRDLFHMRRIRSAMKQAEQDSDGAIEIYQSVLDLYADTEWGNTAEAKEGKELLRKTREVLALLKAAKAKAEEEKRLREEAERKAAAEKAAAEAEAAIANENGEEASSPEDE